MWTRGRKWLRMGWTMVALLACAGPGGIASAATQEQIDAAREKMLAWLLIHQRSDGSWRGTPGSEVAASASALEGLSRAGVNGYPYAAGVSWLANAPIASVDSLSRKIVALRQANLNVTPALQQLLGWRNAARTWGAYDHFETGFPDTPLALAAIRTGNFAYSDADWASALCAMATAQQAGDVTVAGSWSYIKPAPAAVTTMVIPGILPTTNNILELEAFRAWRGVSGLTCSATSY